LVLTNNTNDFTGTTTIDRGSIIIKSNNALGSTTGKTIVTYGQATTDLNERQGGTLQLMNGITVAEPINIKGLKLNHVNNASKIWLFRPNIGKINPTDCIDMDCDGKNTC
jgi:autotransporter-associated beta strand protein